jgi:3-oxoacyl-[acyl-carrier protein] reductase
MRLENKVAIVTGAASGIGSAIAERFLKEGARVVLADINVCPLPEGIDQSRAHCIDVDTSKKEDVERMVATTIERFGGLDIIVNNAGVGLAGEIATMPDEVWEKVIAINLSGVFYGMHAAAREMRSRKTKGSIINMTSILGQVGFAGAGAYAASKGGVNQLTRTGALELSKDGIRVNAIAPGFIKTNMTKGIQENEETNKMVIAATPLGHMGEPSDIANAALYLASDESAFVTGSILYVDGGWTAQ